MDFLWSILNKIKSGFLVNTYKNIKANNYLSWGFPIGTTTKLGVFATATLLQNSVIE